MITYVGIYCHISEYLFMYMYMYIYIYMAPHSYQRNGCHIYIYIYIYISCVYIVVVDIHPMDLGRFCPPHWGTNLGTFPDTNLQKTVGSDKNMHLLPLVTLSPKWCSEGLLFRGPNFSGKKVFATIPGSPQERAGAGESGGGSLKELLKTGG